MVKEMIEQIFKECNFAVSALETVTRSTGEIEIPSLYIADYALKASNASSFNISQISPATVQEWILSFMAESQSMLALDMNNEFQVMGKKKNKATGHGKGYTERKQEVKGREAQGKTEEDDLFMLNLAKTIAAYEELARKEKSEGKDPAPTEKVLASLKNQLTNYMKTNGKTSANKAQLMKSGLSTKKTLTLEEKRTLALEEIFHFYTKQHAVANGKKTFEAMVVERDQMPLAYFTKMIKDFEIPLESKVILSPLTL